MDRVVSDYKNPFLRFWIFPRSIFGNQTSRKLDDILQKIDSLPKAHTDTRGEIHELKTEFVNLTGDKKENSIGRRM